MAVFLITYDLNNETRRPDITGKLKKTYPYWAKLSESSYAIDTDHTEDQIFDSMKTLLDGDDSFYVIALKRPYSGFGPEEVNDWLAESLPY